MANNNKSFGLVYWILAFVAVGAGLVCLLLVFLQAGDKSIINIAGVFGAYVSFFSLVLMFAQFKSIRDISQETKDQMDALVSVSNLAKHAELARSAQNDVIAGKEDLAIYKIQIIKETLIKLENRDGTNSSIPDYCGRLGTHLTSLRTSKTKVRRSVITKDLEEIADFLLRQEEIIKNKTN